MGDRRSESARADLETLFRLGAVTGLSDAQLLERFAARSDEAGEIAFEAIVRRHGPMVLGVCRRLLRHEQAAEDAFQATFLVLALKAAALRSPGSLGPWLHGVAARVARRALSSSRRHRPKRLPDEGPSVDAPDPDRFELAAVIDEELARLPEKYRAPVVLCYLEGRTQVEAAQALGWPEGTVAGRLARAKELLRRRLTRRGLAPSVGAVAAAFASEAASAAVPSALRAATVRVATAGILGGAEAGAVAASVASLARAALRWILVARVVRTAAQSLVLGVTAAVLAAPLLTTGEPAGPGAPAAVAARPAAIPTLRLDRFGDPLPVGVAARLGTIQRRHTGRVVGIDFDRDGRVVSVQSDGLVRFWDGRTGRQLRADSLVDDAPGADRAISLVAVSPDGRLVAASGFDAGKVRPRGRHPVWIWELEPHRLRFRLEVETPALLALAVSPDGATLATGGFGGDVQLWEIATGNRRSAFRIGSFPVHALAFAPDGQSLVATAQGHPVVLWDLEESQVTSLADLKGSGSSPQFSPDGRLLAVPELARGIALWDRAGGRECARIPGTVPVFAPDGRSLAAIDVRKLTVLDVPACRPRWEAGIDWGLSAMPPAFSPDGKTLVQETDGILRFFDADSGRERFDDADSPQGKMSTVRYSPDGRILSAEFGGAVRIWDPVSARPLGVIRHRGRVELLAVSPDGRSLATTSWHQPHASVSVWDIGTCGLRREWTVPGAKELPKALAFSVDGEAVLVYGGDRRLEVLEIATGQERPCVQPRFTLAGRPPFGQIMPPGQGFSPGNRFLAVRAGKTAHVADLATGEERLSRPCDALAFAPDGKTLAIATPARPAPGDPGRGTGPVATLNSEEIRLVDLDSGRELGIPIAPDVVRALAFSTDGDLLAVAEGLRRPSIRIYRTRDGRELEALPAPAAVTHRDGLAFSPDGRGLAAGLDDTTIPIWDLRDLH